MEWEEANVYCKTEPDINVLELEHKEQLRRMSDFGDSISPFESSLADSLEREEQLRRIKEIQDALKESEEERLRNQKIADELADKEKVYGLFHYSLNHLDFLC